METILPEQRCSRCGYRMDATTSAFGEHKPKPGDVSLCMACGGVSVFTETLHMRAPTPEELDNINKNPQVLAAQMAIAHIVGDKLKRKQTKHDHRGTKTTTEPPQT
jgi:hypothetical protein